MVITTKLEGHFDILRLRKLREISLITAWIQMFVRNVINPQNEKVGTLSTERELTEVYWIKNTCM